ncbi:MAG TPA: FUSC family protein [Candidatus Sulfotelmatobacter sp.]|nr:FUSC family protein [Candidatus Sulfotelmatobacter sp.]
MASSNLSGSLANTSIGRGQSFWAREAPALKQGIKTGLAGAIAYAIYAGWNLPQGYWAVFAALVVTQANLGASWKAALYRTIGSTCGAIAAALLVPWLGKGPVGVGIVLLLLGSLFGYLTALHTAFTAAGFTAALILVFGGMGEPWHMAWLRVLYTILGAVIAFLVGALLWPVHAREVLRQKIANILAGAGALYRAVTAAALQGVDNEAQVRVLDRRLHDLRRGITQQMDEARSELAFHRFNESAYQRLIELADQIRRRLTAMAEDRSLYIHAQASPGLVPSIAALAQKTTEHFVALAQAVLQPKMELNSAELEAAVKAMETELAGLREQRATAPFALDRMLPFWALVFNLREVAEDLKELESALPALA